MEREGEGGLRGSGHAGYVSTTEDEMRRSFRRAPSVQLHRDSLAVADGLTASLPQDARSP